MARARVLALLLGAAAAPAAAQNQQGSWQDTTYLDAVIRLDIENGPSAVIPALTYGSTLLLPLRQYLQMVEVRVAAFALRDSAVAVVEPGRVPVRFRPAERMLTRGGESVPYDTLDIVWWDGDLFVATGVLDRLLGTSSLVDWTSLAAMVGRSSALPVVLRARRERRRQLMGGERPAPDVLDLALRQRAVDGAVMSWSLTAASRGPTNQFALDLGFGAGLFGGSAELRPVYWSTYGASGSELRWSWSRTSTGTSGIRQVRVGDVHSNGRRARLLQGVVVTNAPFIRSSEFDVEQFVTQVPPGWEAELYESGRLLAFADQDAVGAFRVPLQLGYGQNPFELVLYGPGGETVRQARTIRVPFSRLPGRRLEYALAAGRCRGEACHGLLSADARYGVSGRLTLQAGSDAVFYGSGTQWQPYAVVSGAVLPALGLTGEAVVHGHLRASANFEPSLDLRVTLGHTRFSSASVRFGETFSEADRSEATVFWRPGWMRGAAYLQGTGVFSTGPALERRLARLAATTRVGRVRYSVGALRDVVDGAAASPARRFALDGAADAILGGPWPWLRGASVQSQLAFEPANGLSAARTLVGRRVSRSLRLDAGWSWLRGAGVSVELAFATATPGPRFGARSRVSADAGTQGLLTSSGSLAFDPRTRLMRLSDATDLGRAGISGVLFRDDNANGERDPGEPGLPGIPVRVGGWPAETDADGRFAAWGLYPSEPLRIDVDTLSLGNPQFVLPAPVLRVRPAPNAFGAIAVPVVVGAEISGFVVLGEQPLAGVPVILREMNTGAEITTLTFSDGGFYRGGVPPGEYEVTLPDGVQEQLQVAVPPLHIFVPPGAGEKRYQDLHLRLEPRS